MLWRNQTQLLSFCGVHCYRKLCERRNLTWLIQSCLISFPDIELSGYTEIFSGIFLCNTSMSLVLMDCSGRRYVGGKCYFNNMIHLPRSKSYIKYIGPAGAKCGPHNHIIIDNLNIFYTSPWKADIAKSKE